MVGLSKWLCCFGSTAAFTSRKEIRMLDVNFVLNLLIQCSDTSIASYLTSIILDVTS